MAIIVYTNWSLLLAMRSKILLFLGLVIATILLGAAKFIPKAFFPIQRFECAIGDQQCPDIVSSSLQPLVGKSLFFTDFPTELSKLSLPAYEVASLQKKLPATLVLSLKPKTNRYLIRLPNGEEWLVADNGYAQLKTSDHSLPSLSVSNHWTQPINDQHIDQNLHAVALPLVNNLQQYGIATSEIRLESPSEIHLALTNGLAVVASNEKNAEQMRKLSIILKEVNLNEVDMAIKTIDLRFAFPILKP